MKLAKLSLAAIIVVGLSSNSYAADSLSDAFKNGKVNGELRAWYFDKDTGIVHEDIVNTGVMLKYITDSFVGLKIGTTVQSSYAPFADENAKDLFKKNEYGSGAVFSEAYLSYTLDKTELKVGRQFISTPLISGSGSRMIKESFEGLTLTNTNIPQTTLYAAYVDKFQGRTAFIADSTDIGSVGKFTKTYVISTGTGAAHINGYIDDAYTVGLINKSINGLMLSGQYAVAEDVAHLGNANIYNLEAKYIIPINNFKVGLDVMYRASSTDSELDSYKLQGSYFGGRMGIYDISGFDVSIAMSKTDKSDDLIAGLGNGADDTYTGTIYSSNASYARNTNSYAGKLLYDFSKIGINGLTSYFLYAVDKQNETSTGNKTSGDWKISALDVTYAFPGALKGFSTSLQYEKQENDKLVSGVSSNVTANEYRFRATYKF